MTMQIQKATRTFFSLCSLILINAAQADTPQLCTDFQTTVRTDQPSDSTRVAYLLVHVNALNTANSEAAISDTVNSTFTNSSDTPGRLGSSGLRRLRSRFPEVVSVRPLRYVPNTFVFQWTYDAKRTNSSALQKRSADFAKRLGNALDHDSSVRKFRSGRYVPITAKAEFSYPLHTNAYLPHDPYLKLPNQWNSTQWNLTGDSGIRADIAWERLSTLNVPSVTVAVIDTGVGNSMTTTELDSQTLLSGKLFIDATDSSGNPYPQNDTDGHGTGIASIISSKTNNSEGIAGITWNGRDSQAALIAKILPIKIQAVHNASPFNEQYSETGGCTHNLLDAIAYAADPTPTADERQFFDLQVTGLPGSYSVQQNVLPPTQFFPADAASVINLSSSFSVRSDLVYALLQRVQMHFPKTLLVVAPANSISNLDQANDYPAKYGLPNVLTVSNTADDMCILGPKGTSIDILAPGTGIPMLTLTGSIDTATGTSFAAPHVAGAAAVLSSLAPSNWTYKELKEYLTKSASRRMCVVGSQIGSVAACKQPSDPPEKSPSICNSSMITGSTGLLDLDRATAPPLDFVDLKETTVWDASNAPIQVALVQTFDPEVVNNGSTIKLCGKVNAELQLFRNGSTSNVPYKIVSLTQIDRSTLATSSAIVEVPSLIAFHPGGPVENMALGRLRLQCSDSELFRLSTLFKVQFPPQPSNPLPPVISVTEARRPPPYSSALRDEARLLR